MCVCVCVYVNLYMYVCVCVCVVGGGASQVALVVKNPPANARDLRDVGSIPGSGRSPGEENGNPLQYSCLESPMDRGAWRAAVHRVTRSRTQLSTLAHTCVYTHICPLPLEPPYHPTSHPAGSSQSTGLSSLCYTRGCNFH